MKKEVFVSKSKFKNYKTKIRYLLVKHYNWESADAINWIRDHPGYMHDMWIKGVPTISLAKNIHNKED